MFRLATDPQFTHRVTVAVPVDGGHEAQTMEVRYRVLPVEAVGDFDLSSERGTADFLWQAVVVVSDLVNDDGETILWCNQVRDRLFALPHVRLALVRGYFAAVTEARVKN